MTVNIGTRHCRSDTVTLSSPPPQLSGSASSLGLDGAGGSRAHPLSSSWAPQHPSIDSTSRYAQRLLPAQASLSSSGTLGSSLPLVLSLAL